MKKILSPTYGVVAWMILAAGKSTFAIGTNAVVHVGIYDSRAVAYAWFSSPAHQQRLKELIQSARAAESGGDTSLFLQLKTKVLAEQDEMHREVFSTAPAGPALAELKDRLPVLATGAGVSGLVSEWDEAELKKHSGEEQVDVTDKLVMEFKPTEKQLKVIQSIRQSKPLPLEKCNELIRAGKI